MHMRYKRYLLLLLLVLPSMVRLRAQDDTQLSQYWAMPSYYNAGAAGIYEKLNLRAATRQQWVGMPGAPKSFLVLADMPLRFLKADHTGCKDDLTDGGTGAAYVDAAEHPAIGQYQICLHNYLLV